LLFWVFLSPDVGFDDARMIGSEDCEDVVDAGLVLLGYGFVVRVGFLTKERHSRNASATVYVSLGSILGFLLFMFFRVVDGSASTA